ncbi:MAG TPA: DUF1573 domain-containing protein [Hanamia sp.]
MKKWLMVFVIITSLFSCDIRNNKNNPNSLARMDAGFSDTTSVQMIDSTYDFGKVVEGQKVEHNYRFKNTGNKALVVSAATASCGCTVPEKPEEPVKPGETGILKVVFNSAGRPGPAHKTITVVSNAYPGFPVLVLTGLVENKS